jgi:spore coat protein U-like protein
MMRHTILALCGLVIAAAPAAAVGAVEFEGTPSQIAATYDPQAEVVSTERFTVSYPDTTPTDYFVDFTAGGSGDVNNRTLTDGSGNSLDYQLMDSAGSRNVLKDRNTATSDQEVITGSFSGSGQRQHSFDLVLFSGQFPPSGSYTDNFRMRLYEGQLGSAGWLDLGGTANPSVSVTVPSIVRLSLVNPGGVFDPSDTDQRMDFGILQPGKTRQADLVVRANETFSVSLSSQHGGSLAITDPSETSTIPYQLTFDGTTVDLSGGTSVTVLSGVGPTSLSGLRYLMEAEILSFDLPTEGTYRDNITITVSAQ